MSLWHCEVHGLTGPTFCCGLASRVEGMELRDMPPQGIAFTPSPTATPEPAAEAKCANCGHPKHMHSETMHCQSQHSSSGSGWGMAWACRCREFVEARRDPAAGEEPTTEKDGVVVAHILKKIEQGCPSIPIGWARVLAAAIKESRDDRDEARRSLQKSRSELAAERNAPCNVCVGRPLPSGRPCICGGKGTEQAELQGFREQAFDDAETIAKIKADNELWRSRAEDAERKLAKAQATINELE